MELDEARKRAYSEAYQRWQRDLTRLHSLLLDGEALDPPHRIALLRSESHTHDRYEEARRQLLGIGEDSAGPSTFTAGDGDNA